MINFLVANKLRFSVLMPSLVLSIPFRTGLSLRAVEVNSTTEHVSANHLRRLWLQYRALDLFAGHLTSRSDVYSFGVVLLEMLTGRRSVDKHRPPGEQNLVEWARPYLNDKRKFYKLIDPRLEGQYSVKGAQKAAVLSHHCLSRDPKSRPLMGDVVDTLKPLQDMRDMASGSGHHQSSSNNYRTSGHQNGNSAGRSNYHSNHGPKKYEQLRNIPVRASGVSPLPTY